MKYGNSAKYGVIFKYRNNKNKNSNKVQAWQVIDQKKKYGNCNLNCRFSLSLRERELIKYDQLKHRLPTNTRQY